MAASDHLGIQFPVSEFKNVRSYEYDKPMHQVGADVRRVDARRGKPDHMETLRADIRANGIRQPIEMIHHNDQLWMSEGHHRAVIAQEEGMEHVPVTVFNQKTYEPMKYNPVNPGGRLAEWKRL
jgi:ParB/Sulfiredoxin domain